MNERTLHLAPEHAEAAALDLQFEVFFDREKARLFQALCLVTRNRFEAEELVQDAFVAVYEAVGARPGDGGPDGLPLPDRHQHLPLMASALGAGGQAGDRPDAER